ncbi:MAG: hypothetical protein U5L45_17490 [Saprospiraceae bacterium]|nr:hypothetical protein [Saprospiraceae bacterium]
MVRFSGFARKTNHLSSLVRAKSVYHPNTFGRARDEVITIFKTPSSRHKNLSLIIFHLSLKKGHHFKTIIPQPFSLQFYLL